MATAKSKKAATKQKKMAKSPVKKAVKSAAGAKKAVKKSSAKKEKSTKAQAAKPAKSAGGKTAKKAAGVKSGAVKSTKVAGVKKSVKPVSKVAVKPASSQSKSKKEVAVKAPKASAVVAKKPGQVPAKPTAVKLKEKGSSAKEKTIIPAVKSPKSEKTQQKDLRTPAAKPSKSKKEQEADGEEGPDPVQLKTDKLIKELEESMDLSKMRPRIQAGTTPKPLVKQAHPPLRLIEPTNTNKEKYQLEFEFRSSPKILFTALSDSSGLAGWFADEVKTKDDLYTFIWEGGESHAKLVAIRDLQLVRFQWLDDTDGTYFQFEIKMDDITSDIALIITDFAFPGEKDTNIKLWEAQVQKLRMVLGSL